MLSLGAIVFLIGCVTRTGAQYGYISLNARALSDTQVLVSRYDVGEVNLANLDFSYRQDGTAAWSTFRFNPTRQYFPVTELNTSSLYYFRLEGRQMRSYSMLHAYTHIRTPPYSQRAPSNVTAVTLDDDSVKVAWSPEPDGRVLGYLVIYTEVDSKDRSLTEYKVKPVFRDFQTVLRDIKGSSRYKVEVASISLDGEGSSKQSVYVGDEKTPFLRMVIPPRDSKVKDEGILILVCRADGYPTPKVTWRKSGRLFDDRNRRIYEDSSDGVSILRIDPVVSRQDRGTYTCIASNGFGEIVRARATIKTYRAKDNIPGYPVISQHPVLNFVEEGAEVIMNCTSEGTPDIITRWFKDSFPVYYSKDNRVALGANAQLIIVRVKLSDEGKYECSAQNDLGVVFSYPAHLYVKERLLLMTPPTFLRSKLRHKVNYGEELTLTCDAVGRPVPDVWWEQGGKRLKGRSHNGQNIKVLQDMRQTSIYTCVASNPLDTIRKEYKVTVIEPRVEDTMVAPTFKPATLSVKVKFTGSTSLTCEAEGDPVPRVIWLLQGKILKRKSENGKNVLRLTRLRNSGNYTCTASNIAGNASQVYNVTVASKVERFRVSRPVDLKSAVVMPNEVELKWDPPKNLSGVTGFAVYVVDPITNLETREEIPMVYNYTVTNLKPDRQYIIRVTSLAKSLDGKGTPAIKVKTLKFAPTDVTAKAIDKSTIVVKWKLPEDPSVRVYRGVDVEYRQMNDEGAVVKQEVQRYAGRGNSLYIRALNPATTYQVQVRARTEVGEGIPSDVVMVTTDPEIPEPPFRLQAVDITHNEAEISWSTRTPIARLTSFNVYVRDVSTGRDRLHHMRSSGDSSYRIRDLLQDKQYEVTISSEINGQAGNRSLPIRFRTKPFVPDAPNDVKADAVNATTILVTWGTANDPVSRSYITGYRIQYEELARYTGSKTLDVSRGNRGMLTSLNENTTYKIQVRGYSERGDGKLSTPIQAKTLVSPQPVDLQATLVSHNSIHLSWDAPILLRSITSFNVYVHDDVTGKVTKTSVRPAKEHTITGLQSDRHYTLTVASVVKSREQERSQPLSVATLPYVPDPPSDVVVAIVNETAVKVEWTLIKDDAHAIVNYHVAYSELGRAGVSEGRTVSRRSERVVLWPLEMDTSYNVRVRAETASQKGVYSQPTVVTTLASDKPNDIDASNIQFNQADITWYAPTKKRNITEFRLVVSDTVTGEKTRLNIPPVTEYTVTELYPDRKYIITVRSRMGALRGKRSEEYVFKTLPYIPTSPVGVVATPLNDTAVMVQWTPTVDDDTRRYVTSYNIAYTRQGSNTEGGAEESLLVPEDSTMATITSLAADTSYRVRVRAETQTEKGQYSLPNLVKTYVSDKPQSLRLTDIQFNEARVSWYAAVQQRNITGFRLALTDVMDNDVQIQRIGPVQQFAFEKLKPDRKYTLTVTSLFEVKQGKESDAMEFQTLPFVPGPPSNIRTTPLNDTAVLLEWTQTVDEETRRYIRGYTIVYSKQDGMRRDEESLQVSDVNMAVISALAPDTSYRLRIRAETLTEAGEYTKPIYMNTLVSDKPVSLRTSKIEFNQVGVLWYAPINDRGISGFQLVLSDVDGGGMAELNTPPILQYTLSGLKPDRKYTFSVTSQLGDHEGKTSDLLSFRTLPYVPEAPSDVTITSPNETTLVVKWTPTVNDETRGYVVGYNIAYSKEDRSRGDGGEEGVQVAGSSSMAVITSLDADTSYRVRVRAETLTEKGQYSEPLVFQTLETDKPLGLQASRIQFNQARLSWYAPVTQRNITNFHLVLHNLKTEEVTRSVIPPRTVHIVSGLFADTQYELVITSQMDDQEGKSSDVFEFKTLPFVPDAPDNIVSRPLNDTAVLVEWTPTVNNETRSYILRYHITYNKLERSQRVTDMRSVQVPGHSNTAIITFLDADTSYILRVRAETLTENGALSPSIIVRTLESDKPRAVRTTNIEFNQVELSWYAPTEQRNITGFEVLLTDNVTGEVTGQETLPNSRYTVTNLKADRTYKLTVTSLLGSLQGKTSDVLEFVTKPFVPAVIEDVAVTPLNQSTLLIHWKVPDSIGSHDYITLYRVEYSLLDRFQRVKETWSLEVDEGEDHAYITGLEGDTEYRIRMRSETETQQGKYTRGKRTKTLMSEKPRRLKVTEVLFSSISISWKAPIKQRNITSFKVITFDTIEGTEQTRQIPPKLNFRIDNLLPDRAYGIRVSALIGEHEGKSSKTIEVKTNPYIPRAPTEVKAHPVNATAVYVEWKAPDDLFARQYVIGFNIQYDRSRSRLPVEKWSLLEHYGGKQNSLITSLEPDTEYNLMVSVNTKTEKGELSRQISVKTMVSAEPMDLKTTRVSFDEFVLTWDAPVEERNITGFAVYLTDRTNNSRVREEMPAVLTHTFQGLTPSTVYLADVASILHSGEGILSQQIPVETAPFIPDAPTEVQARSYNFSTIAFMWQLPEDPASRVYIKGSQILYTKLSRDGSPPVTRQHQVLGQSRENLLTSLEEDSTYRVQIRGFSDTAEGKLSRAITISTPPQVPDWAPELLTASVEYDASVRLEWYVHSPKAALDHTLKYEVQYFRQPDPYSDMYVRDLDSGPTIIDNLETHSTYSFRLRAYNPSGFGPWSSSLEATLDGPDLGVINIMHINRTGPYSSKVRWVQRGKTDYDVQGYRVYYTPIDYKFQPVPGQRFVDSVGTRNRVDIIRSLRPEQYYHVQVAAFADEGIGRRTDVVFLPDMDYPRILIGPRNTKIAAKLAVTFSCKVVGEPGFTVFWKKGLKRITKRLSRFQYKIDNGTSILRIKSARPRDTGVYECVLNVNNTLYSKSAKLEVYDQAAIPSGYPSFTRNPTLTSVETGSNTSFICEASGNPIPIIKWHKNNIPLQETNKFVITQIVTVYGTRAGRESRLWILNATVSDMGKYVCSAENRFGTIYNFDAQLYVKLKKSPPEFSEFPEDAYVKPGSPVTLSCAAEGVPEPTIRWLVDGTYLETTEVSTGRGQLVLPEVYVSALYTCEVKNIKGTDSIDARVQIDRTVKFKGVILRKPQGKAVVVGASVSFFCHGVGQPKPNVFWERNGKRLSRQDFDQTYYLEERDGVSVLEVGKVQESRDEGAFSCTVENDLGYSEAATTLKVYRLNERPEDFPSIVKHPVVTAAARGETIRLYCSSNDPTASVTWYKDRFPLQLSERARVTMKDGASELRILKARDKDYGKYHCSMENASGIVYSKRAMLYIRRAVRKS
ncbi:protein sidekick-2-like isoform X3 [Haliotis rufescens]|uniref:protein sidekick-2-like isoform X3 n=1 Tax=Haliotis rufescens TaxID=6454 RepID=UPI00201EF6B2|nr:protein sidekick-2-like isoform X3 [Haliotis rufescens]